jgi:hypothetical protein
VKEKIKYRRKGRLQIPVCDGFCSSGPFFVKARRQTFTGNLLPLRAGLTDSLQDVLPCGRGITFKRTRAP